MNEAELALTDLLKCDRLSLYLNKDKYLDKVQGQIFADIFKRRISREPLQYILGKADFMGLVFKVNKDVLIPRPETEILVEKAIEYVTKSPSHQVTKLLDIGTGSGCVAVSLAKFLTDCKITAVDISEEAISIAKDNALLNSVTEKIDFMTQDFFNWGSFIKGRPGTGGRGSFDFIVSNPPYIPSVEINKLQAEVQFEPRLALDGGEDGLSFYRRLSKESPDYLKAGGYLIMEMGFNQSPEIKNIFQNTGIFEIMEVVKDYNNIERVLIVKRGQSFNRLK